jgi:DivIVA domain-containing protein
VDQDSVERIRSATFNMARRGYDRREVDTFLQKLADWLEGGGEEQAQSEMMQRELERIGRRTAKVLTVAGEAADALKADAEVEAREALDEARIAANAARTDADRYAERTRSEAEEYALAERGRVDSYAAETRAEADAYDQATRTDADAYAGQTREAAEALARDLRADAEQDARKMRDAAKAEAERDLREGQKRRQSLETVIGDLEQRRELLLDSLEQLAGSLAGTASKHRADGAATPAAEQGSAEKRA